MYYQEVCIRGLLSCNHVFFFWLWQNIIFLESLYLHPPLCSLLLSSKLQIDKQSYNFFQLFFFLLREHFNMTSSWLGGWVVWKSSIYDDNDNKGVVRAYLFFDYKRWLILSSASGRIEKKTLFVCPFFVWPEIKKNVSLFLQKNNNFLYLFVFFSSHNDDNWWQVGRWYGIPNLVITWWLRWVVTKLLKCWWRHIEMVP